ncbi:MAG: UDP-N-acetylglucosamine--LPS N-acetylglucosamine transferase [Cyanobacteria bacterium P01_F01_bin.86]
MSKIWARANWLIYALGGGWGHLNRAIALARVAVTYADIHILTNSLYQHKIGSLKDRIYLHRIDPVTNLSATCNQVQQFITSQSWDCMIVDTFPRGVGGELVDMLLRINCSKVLIHRDLRPAYIHQKAIVPVAAEFYDLILVPGELGFALLTNLPQTVRTPPWLIRSDIELPDLANAHALLNLALSGHQPVLVVLAGGRPEEQIWYGRVTQALAKNFPNITVRCIAPVCPEHCLQELWISHYPAIECLLAAHFVIGSGGYNTVNECRALSIPLIARPFSRLYDRQHLRITYARLQGAEIAPVATLDDVLATVAYFLQTERLTLRHQVRFTNGVQPAVKAIRSVLGKRSLL